MRFIICILAVSCLLMRVDAQNCDGKLTLTGDPEKGATWRYESVEDGITYDISGFLLRPSGKGKFPAVIISHGKGGNAPLMVGNIGRTMVKWGLVCIGVNYTHAREPFCVGSPGENRREDWGANQPNVLRAGKLFDILESLGYVDMSRIGAYGHSMGAFMTGAIAGSYPDKIIVAAQTAGGASPDVGFKDSAIITRKEQYERITVPYLIHHGVLDKVVPVEAGRFLHRQLQTQGVVTEMIEYANYSHSDIPSREDVLSATKSWYQEHGLIP